MSRFKSMSYRYNIHLSKGFVASPINKKNVTGQLQLHAHIQRGGGGVGGALGPPPWIITGGNRFP